MLSNFKNILVLAPHTDDGEFGCGGTIAKLIDQGKNVFYAAFSTAEESVPEHLPKDILKTEVKKATKFLGILRKNLIIYDYRVRYLHESRQEILEELVKLNKEIKPDLVFMPCHHDLHQDHSVVSIEGLRAFKKTSILTYEIPWNNLKFSTQCFSVLHEKYIDKKIGALLCYESQLHKDYASKEFIKSLAKTRGVQIGSKYAEVFEVIRWVI